MCQCEAPGEILWAYQGIADGTIWLSEYYYPPTPVMSLSETPVQDIISIICNIRIVFKGISSLSSCMVSQIPITVNIPWYASHW